MDLQAATDENYGPSRQRDINDSTAVKDAKSILGETKTNVVELGF